MDKPLRSDHSYISVHAQRHLDLQVAAASRYDWAKSVDALAVLLYEQRAREQRTYGTTTAAMLAESL
jgi:hypothetical protein